MSSIDKKNKNLTRLLHTRPIPKLIKQGKNQCIGGRVILVVVFALMSVITN